MAQGQATDPGQAAQLYYQQQPQQNGEAAAQSGTPAHYAPSLLDASRDISKYISVNIKVYHNEDISDNMFVYFIKSVYFY